jgi:hypothetical protein
MLKSSVRPSVATVLAIATAGFAVVALAQSAPPAPSPVKRAIDERKAIYTLVAANFRPLGETLQNRSPYDSTQLRKRAARLAFLAALASDAYPILMCPTPALMQHVRKRKSGNHVRSSTPDSRIS